MKNTLVTLIIFFTLFSQNTQAQSNITLSGNAASNSAKARVNFVITVPEKLSLTVTNGNTTASSNSGDLYIATNGLTANRYAPANQVTYKTMPRQETYTIASP